MKHTKNLRGSLSRQEQAEMSRAAARNRSTTAKDVLRIAKQAHKVYLDSQGQQQSMITMGRNGPRQAALGAHVGSPFAFHDEN